MNYLLLFKNIWYNCVKRLKKYHIKNLRITKHQTRGEPKPCIRCDKCAMICPADLLPQQLFWHIQGNQLKQAADIGLFSCTECRLCEQVCPSDIPLVSFYQKAKMVVTQQEEEKIIAQKAKIHFQEKQIRSEKKKLSAQNKKDNIRAALARVKENLS